MAETLRLFYTTSHHCWSKRTLFWGEVVLSGEENVVKGTDWLCLLPGFFFYLSLYLLLLMLLLSVFLSHCYFQWIVLISTRSLVVLLNWKIPVLNYNNQLLSNFCLSFLMLPMWTSLLSVLQIEKRGGRQVFPSPLLHAIWPWRMGRKFWNVWLKHALVYIYFSWSEMSKSFHSFFFFFPFCFHETLTFLRKLAFFGISHISTNL